jgi:hypothetical protein
MQLFAVALETDGPVDEVELVRAVRSAAVEFPRLSGGALASGRSRRGRLAYAALAHQDGLAAPRRYAATRANLVTLLDGYPVDPRGRFRAADAQALMEHWADLPDSLEGMFAALRIDLATDRVDCRVDILGMLRVFLWRREGSWVLSNSVAVLRSLTGASELDPVGVSALITLGWPAGHTLLRDVQQLEGGRLYALGPDGLRSRPTFSAAALAPATNPRPIESAASLAARMRRTLATAVEGVPQVSCAVTGGRDSRVLLALSLGLGAPIDYSGSISGRAALQLPPSSA